MTDLDIPAYLLPIVCPVFYLSPFLLFLGYNETSFLFLKQAKPRGLLHLLFSTSELLFPPIST